MSSLNKVILIGKLGRDPEMRYTTAGQPCSNFSIATDETYMGKVGYLKARLESCRREAEAIPSVEAELAAALHELEQFNARIGA